LADHKSLSGPNRELKKAVEAYWAHKIPAQELHATAASLRTANWSTIKAQGVDIVPRCLRLL